MNPSDGTPPSPRIHLALARSVAEVLLANQIEPLIIGGFALAAHNYIRTTEDLDLGVSTDPALLSKLSDDLSAAGFRTELRMPDSADPLGGVIDVANAAGGFVQIINFDNSPAGGFPAVIKDALRALPTAASPSQLRVVPLPYLIALKLYAGGPRSYSDIRELLRANPGAPLDEIRRVCAGYHLDPGDLF